MLKPKSFAPLVPFLFICIVFFSCKDKKLIDEKNYEISTVDDSISTQESNFKVYVTTSDSLSKEKDTQEANSVLYADSAKAVMKDSPIATLYIRENRQNAADILNEYATAHKDSLAGVLLFYHAGLVLYGMSDTNQETIRYVENQTDRFDAQIKNCIRAISAIDQRLAEIQSNIGTCKEQIKTLYNRKEQLEQEVKALNEKGWL